MVVARLLERLERLLVGAGLPGELDDLVAAAEPGPQLGGRRRRHAERAGRRRPFVAQGGQPRGGLVAVLNAGRAAGAVAVELREPLGLAGDAVRLAAETVGQGVGQGLALLEGIRQIAARGRAAPPSPPSQAERMRFQVSSRRARAAWRSFSVGTSCSRFRAWTWASSWPISSPSAVALVVEGLEHGLGGLDRGLETVERGIERHGQPLEVVERTRPARQPRQCPCGRFLGPALRGAGLVVPFVEIAGLAGLPDRMAQGFDVARFAQVGQLAIEPLDLVFEPGDRLERLRRAGPTARRIAWPGRG